MSGLGAWDSVDRGCSARIVVKQVFLFVVGVAARKGEPGRWLLKLLSLFLIVRAPTHSMWVAKKAEVKS